jgi:hypothetical protein
MTFFYSKFITCIALFSISSCLAIAQNSNKKTYQVALKTATDAEYPNNNMIGYKSVLDGVFSHKLALMSENEEGNFDFTILPSNEKSDTLFVKNVNVLEFMPSIPAHVKKDKYLSFLAALNQEWNRIQVKFDNKLFSTAGKGVEKDKVSRVDIANNCLAKGLWEILAFTTENKNDSMYFQCWFDFPEDLYNQLFLKRNGISIAEYDNALKNYNHDAGKKINLKVLRKVNSEKTIAFTVLNKDYYTLKGERASKLKNIVFPTSVASINDFLTDKTTYATFAPPGQYTRSDPRKTQLSRFQHLDKVMLLQTTSTNKAAIKAHEIQLFYSDNEKTKKTTYLIGGLQLDKLPILKTNNLCNGWQRPMGISNHSFYTAYDDFIAQSSAENAYFSFLLNEKGEWLDSHDVGIDGILLYRDAADVSKIHAFILSFERHSFVGHVVFDVPLATTPPQYNQ